MNKPEENPNLSNLSPGKQLAYHNMRHTIEAMDTDQLRHFCLELSLSLLSTQQACQDLYKETHAPSLGLDK